ncbi:MAG TPA: 4Fe-4S single cluster domain-containing protein [Capsulimonadaceae bacterium]|jgi:anaerobic ribonucleoside-triphosphate reductase activating protein
MMNEVAENHLRIFRTESPVTVLGPGKRAVVWVQGCHLGCSGCVVPESWDASGGTSVAAATIAEWILAQPDIEGVTFSGGEPMIQATALRQIVEIICGHRDLGVMVYTGYTLEFLQRNADKAQVALLDVTDLLVDGSYIESRHANRLWRGSDNQRLICLTPRYESLVGDLLPSNDRSAGVEVITDSDGAFGFVGVPPRPGFRRQFIDKMAEFGVVVAPADTIAPMKGIQP